MFRALAIDYGLALCHTAPMFRSSRKFVAVLMLLWLPLSGGNALAATISMQVQQGECHEAAMSHNDMGIHHMGAHHQHNAKMSSAADKHGPSCNACGVCHLACTGYLAVPGMEIAAVQTTAREITPYLVVFHSVTSAPLVPPPLVRA
jgi:hypothetical protein